MENLYEDSVMLLKQLIATPSFSKNEDVTASIIADFFDIHGIAYSRVRNNIYATNRQFKACMPSILLNSHHDTVLPNKGYTMNPFEPVETEGRLYGLGSNDAGGCLVSLIAAFRHFYDKPLAKFNIVFAASAEEEISGTNGIELLLPYLGAIDFGIVGEPTNMEMAVAERGLLVIDCIAHGSAGHAARNEGENALYKAVDDINWIRNFKFPKVSEILGESRMTATIMETESKQHNVVPAQCKFVLDIRVNELYTFTEVLQILEDNLQSECTPRSTRMKSSAIPLDHILVQAGARLGKGYYGSPTTSDKALMPFPTLKIGPGNSARSHTANEFIYLEEIKTGIETYIKLIEQLVL